VVGERHLSRAAPPAAKPPAVTYVTDTHALVFFATGALRRMSRRAQRIFERAEDERDRVHVPMTCLFELALLLERDRIRARMSLDEWHAILAARPGFPIEPVVWEDVREARALAPLVDPFDRLIAATAIRLDAPLITSDERIRDSRLLRTVW
jgi:PIN domain nuclease of toxin-antitoxin system